VTLLHGFMLPAGKSAAPLIATHGGITI
jgi:hypothetical protein